MLRAIGGPGVVSRPTEHAALILWRDGYIPGDAYTGDDYAIPPGLRTKRVHVTDGERPQPKLTVLETRRRCPECGEWKDLTREHWHRDPNSRLGWHTICRPCKNAYAREHMRKKRAA